MRAAMLVCAAAIGIGSVAPAAGPLAALVERQSGVSFPEQVRVDGGQFACLGTGIRKVFMFKAYAMAFCVQGDAAQAAVGDYVSRAHPGLAGRPLEKALREDGNFYKSLAVAPADKLVVMKALRDIPAAKLQEAFSESLANVLPPESIHRLLAVLQTDVKEGETVRLRSSGSRVLIDIGAHQEVVDDPQVAQKLWLVWLGPQSVTPTLKDDIALRVGHAPGT